MTDDRKAPRTEPDWWPSFSINQALTWGFQGFAAPILVFLVILLGTTVWGVTFSDANSLQDALRRGKLLAMLGLFLGGGGYGLTALLSQGLKWRTAIRVIGFAAGLAFLWKVSEIWIQTL